MTDCVFCRIVRGQLPAEKIFENDRILAVLDINPLALGHVLVLPKEHFETVGDLPDELFAEWSRRLRDVARAVVSAANAEGYNLLSNNRKCSGQAIPHAHGHVVPRRTGDGIKFSWATAKYREGESAAWGERLRKAFPR